MPFKQTQKMQPFSKLPIEIWLHIFSFLPKEDLLRLRLLNRLISGKVNDDKNLWVPQRKKPIDVHEKAEAILAENSLAQSKITELSFYPASKEISDGSPSTLKNIIQQEDTEFLKYAISEHGQNVYIYALQNQRFDLLEAIRKKHGEKFMFDNLDKKNNSDAKTILEKLVTEKKQVSLNYLYNLIKGEYKFISSFCKPFDYAQYPPKLMGFCSLLCTQVLFNQEQLAIETLKKITEELTETSKGSHLSYDIEHKLLPLVLKNQQVSLANALLLLIDNYFYTYSYYKGTSLHCAIKLFNSDAIALLLQQGYPSLTEVDSDGKTVFELVNSLKEECQAILVSPGEYSKNFLDRQNQKLSKLNEISIWLEQYEKAVPASLKPLQELDTLIDSSLLILNFINPSAAELRNETNNSIPDFLEDCKNIRSEIKTKLAENRKIAKQESIELINKFADLATKSLNPFLSQHTKIANPFIRLWTYIKDGVKILLGKHNLSLNYRYNALLEKQNGFFCKHLPASNSASAKEKAKKQNHEVAFRLFSMCPGALL